MLSLQVTLLALAAWRLTHLIVADNFPPIRWGRRLVVDHAPEWVGDLVSCVYCTSVWVAAAVTATADVAVRVRWPLLTFAAVAAAVPIVEAVVARLEAGIAAADAATAASRAAVASSPAPPAPPAPTTYEPSPRRSNR